MNLKQHPHAANNAVLSLTVNAEVRNLPGAIGHCQLKASIPQADKGEVLGLTSGVCSIGKCLQYPISPGNSTYWHNAASMMSTLAQGQICASYEAFHKGTYVPT